MKALLIVALPVAVVLTLSQNSFAEPIGSSMLKTTRDLAVTWETHDYLDNPDLSQSLKNMRGGDELPGPSVSAPRKRAVSGFSEVLPKQWDWRNHRGTNYMSDHKRGQGECGSCVAFAAVSTLEGTLNIACDSAPKPFDLSRQYFFSCGGGQCKGGWKLSAAVDYLVEKGVPDTPCLTYQSFDGTDVACNEACPDADERLVHKVTATRPTRGWVDVVAIKKALMKGPLLTNIVFYEDLKYYKSGVYRHRTGNQLGGHAVTLVGWDDDDKAWIARNSWGAEWGEGGYFRAAWDDKDTLMGRYTWQLDVNVDNEFCSDYQR